MSLFNAGSLFGGIGQLLGGLFGRSDKPYQKALNEYQNFANRAERTQNPFLQAGQRGIGNFENWLGRMQNPAGFVNSLMGGYQQSPWAQNLLQQSERAGTNAASAAGLIGSTPFAQQLQQNAGMISSQDMQNWLDQVLGVNKVYGQGEQNLMTTGSQAANALTNMYGDYARLMGEGAFGRQAGKNQDLSNMIGGGLQLASSFFL